MVRGILVSLVVAVILAAPAAADSGNGLYEPFPSPTQRSTNGYYDKLGVAVTDRQLRRGAFRRGLRPVAAAAPSARAGVGAGGLGLLALALALAAAGALVLGPRMLGRARRAREA